LFEMHHKVKYWYWYWRLTPLSTIQMFSNKNVKYTVNRKNVTFYF